MPEQNRPNGQGEVLDFAEAITTANVPTLLMVLVQLILGRELSSFLKLRDNWKKYTME